MFRIDGVADFVHRLARGDPQESVLGVTLDGVQHLQ